MKIALWALAFGLCSTSQARLKPDSVIYGVVPPLFGTQPFRAVTAKLGALQDLGVDVLWLSPINQSDDPSQISYAVSDYFTHRLDFGSSRDLKELVTEAHKRDMKIILDFVPNHTSKAHPYHVDIEKNGKTSPYYDYYQRDAQGKIVTYFNWNHLLNLNYAHPGVLRMIESAFRHWINEFSIDGFRVDAAWGIKDRAPHVWPALNKSLLKLKPDLILVAEASAQDSYYEQSGFTLAYDWSLKVGEWAWETVFKSPLTIAAKLHQALRSMKPRTLRFLNNNDTGHRFLTRHGRELTRLAAVLQFTIPGTPVIYTGDEVGAEYEPYVDPPPLSWHDRHHFRPFYKRLIELRKKYPSLNAGTWTPFYSKATPDVYVYLREAKGFQPVLIVLNFGRAAEFTLPQATSVQTLRDVLNDELVTIHSSRVRIRETSAAMFEWNP